MTDFPKIPGASHAVDDEHAYRIDAARSLMTAARELQDTAERIASIAGKLGDPGFASDGYFRSTGMVRDALRAYRVNDAILRVDSALESAMLADRERAVSEPRD